MSEIVTNSVAATGRARWKAELPPVRLWLLAGPDGVLVAVWDAVPDVPVLREGSVDRAEAQYTVRLLPAARPTPAPHAGKVTRALITSPAITFP